MRKERRNCTNYWQFCQVSVIKTVVTQVYLGNCLVFIPRVPCVRHGFSSVHPLSALVDTRWELLQSPAQNCAALKHTAEEQLCSVQEFGDLGPLHFVILLKIPFGQQVGKGSETSRHFLWAWPGFGIITSAFIPWARVWFYGLSQRKAGNRVSLCPHEAKKKQQTGF